MRKPLFPFLTMISESRHLSVALRAPAWARPVAVLGCAGALLSACVVGPDFVRPSEPTITGYVAPDEAYATDPTTKSEDTQRIAIGEKINGDWWRLFRSNKLDDVLKRAIADNFSLAAAKATLTQAKEAVNAANGTRLPQIEFSASATRQKPNFATSGVDGSGPTFNLYQIGPNVSYNLDLFGGLKRQVEQQAALAEFQDYQLSAAYLTLTGNAVQQAINIAATRAQISVVQEIIKEDEKTLAAIREEFNVREATRIDVQTATTQLETDRTQLPVLHQQLSVARHALSALLGKAPAEWSPPDFDLAEFSAPNDVPVSLPAQLVRQRPDILAAEAQLHAASAAVGVAVAQRYPNITLSGSIAQQALSTASLFTPGGTIWSLAAGLTAPIFHGGTLEAQQRAAEAGLDAQLATYKQTVVQSLSQVADVLTALSHDAELIAAQKRATASAENGITMAREEYTTGGNTTLFQLIDAERQLQQARLGYVKAQAQRHLDTVQLFLAMGGGWWEWRAQTASSPER
jgi:NodT family efflux transporter outer membrane factor (OMF) lipoprotein